MSRRGTGSGAKPARYDPYHRPKSNRVIHLTNADDDTLR